MAENETLDLGDRHSGRWRLLLKRFESGEPAEHISGDTVRCLYKTFKNLAELLPLGELLAAARLGAEEVREVVRRCRKGRDYAELFAQQAFIDSDPAQIIEGVARATVDRFLDQIELKVVGVGHWPDMKRFRIMRDNVITLICGDVTRLARKVAENPNEKPRMPARSADQKQKDQRDLLNQSLRPRSGTHG